MGEQLKIPTNPLSEQAMLATGTDRITFPVQHGPQFFKPDRAGNYGNPRLDLLREGFRHGGPGLRNRVLRSTPLPPIARSYSFPARAQVVTPSNLLETADSALRLISAASKMFADKPAQTQDAAGPTTRPAQSHFSTPRVFHHSPIAASHTQASLTGQAVPRAPVAAATTVQEAANNTAHFPRAGVFRANAAAPATISRAGESGSVNLGTRPTVQITTPQQALSSLQDRYNQNARLLAQQLYNNGVIANFADMPKLARALTQVFEVRASALATVLNKASTTESLTAEEVQAALMSLNELGLTQLLKQNAASFDTQPTQVKSSTLANFIVSLFFNPVLSATFRGKLESYMMRQAQLYMAQGRPVVRISAPRVPVYDARGRRLTKEESAFMSDEAEEKETSLVTAPKAGSGTNPDGGDQGQQHEEAAFAA